MHLFPDAARFAETYDAGKPQVVWTELVADLETPVSALLKVAAGEPYHFLLESVEGGATKGRYSILGLAPDMIWRADGDVATLRTEDGSEINETGALASLRRLLDASRIELPENLPPMAAGLVGYLGYDTVRLMEKLPDAGPDSLCLPDGVFIRPTVMLIFDAVKDVLTLVTPARPAATMNAAAAYEAAASRLARVVDRLHKALPADAAVFGPAEAAPAPAVSNTTETRFKQMVAAAKDYITAGDIFQVVLSQRFTRPFALPPAALYRALRRTNPSPYMFYLHFDGFAVVGSSPEILVRVRDDKVTVRPIAGTRPRGNNRSEDADLARDLLGDAKEVAEHLMLLDLGRNDVGRVSEVGSVTVTDRMFIEYYSHVMHIVSNVEGRLAKGKDVLDALAAGFPAGTVSGAPKVRAMEIINELEAEKRGIYAGAVGYFAADGSMDTCIVLRTAVVKDGKIHVQAGAGIVADSDPHSEYMECHHKARAILAAAEIAERFAGTASNAPR